MTVTDASGNIDTFILVITVDEPDGGFPFWVLIPIIAAIAVVVFWFFFKRKPKEKAPKPAKIKMTADPTEILADGKSTSKITLELLDKDGKPVKALVDTEIRIKATGGKLENFIVTIPKGKDKGAAILISSTTSETITVSTKAKGLKKAEKTDSALQLIKLFTVINNEGCTSINNIKRGAPSLCCSIS